MQTSGANCERKHSKPEHSATLNESKLKRLASFSIVNKFSDLH